jgi:cytochrome c551/c552
VSATLRLALSGTVAAFAVVAMFWSDNGHSVASTPSASTNASNLASGRAVFEAKGCVVCHEQVAVGPDLTGLGGRAVDRIDGLDAEDYIRQSVREPQAYIAPGGEGVEMPTLDISNDELTVLTQYLLAR